MSEEKITISNEHTPDMTKARSKLIKKYPDVYRRISHLIGSRLTDEWHNKEVHMAELHYDCDTVSSKIEPLVLRMIGEWKVPEPPQGSNSYSVKYRKNYLGGKESRSLGERNVIPVYTGHVIKF